MLIVLLYEFFQKPYKRCGIYLYFKTQCVMSNDKNKSYNVRTIEANRLQNPYLVSPGYILIYPYMAICVALIVIYGYLLYSS